MTPEELKKIARDERAYRTACQLMADGRIKNLRVDGEHSFSATVEDPPYTYQVSAGFSGGELVSCSCSCKTPVAHRRVCAHVGALCLELAKEGRTQVLLNKARREAALQVLSWFETPSAREQALKMLVTVEAAPQGEAAGLISLRVGQKRMYVVQDISTFIKAYTAGEEIAFGKGLTIESQWQCFLPDKERLLQYLKEVVTARELALGRPVLRERQLPLTNEQLRRVLQMLAQSVFQLTIDGETSTIRGIQAAAVPAQFTLRSAGKELELEARLPPDCVRLTREGQFIFMEGRVVGLSAAQQHALIPFLRKEGLTRCRFTLAEGELLVSEVLPLIREVAQVQVDETVSSRIVTESLTATVTLDTVNGDIVAQVAFIYGKTRIDPFSPPTDRTENVLLLRDAAAERAVLDLLGRHGFKVRLKEAYLSGSDAIYNFLQDGVPLLQSQAEVYCSESLLRMRPRRSRPKGKLRMSSSGDLLQFELLLEGVDPSEYDGVMQALREKKKFVRLTDGTFLSLLPDDGWAELAGYLGEVGEVKGGVVEMMRCRAVYLSQLMAASNLEIEQDQSVTDLTYAVQHPDEGEAPIKGLRPYQQRGFAWLKTLARLGMGGVLADDMGLGKTIQVLALIQWGYEELGRMPSLVVAPTSLVYNWQAEINKFTPHMRTLVLSGGKEERKKQAEDLENLDVLIASYAQVRRDIEWLETFSFRFCILDEAQQIKNAASVGAGAAKRIKAQSRFALTGTPMENHPGELWSIFDFVLPGYLMDQQDFLQRHGDGSDSDLLAKKIRPFLMRRLKREVLSELPEKIEHRIVAELTPEQRSIYLATLAQVKKDLDEAVKNEGLDRAHFQMLAAITRLRQICCHPAMFLEGYEGGSGKLELMMELVQEQVESGHRILIFSQFTSMLGIIREQLGKAGIGNMYLDGNTPPQDRLKLTETFNKGETPVFLISLRAGGYGLNLTAADTVIHYDPWWNPAVEDQATDRAHRIGQTRAVHVIRLIAHDTIEEKVSELQMRKKELIDLVVTPGEVLPSALSLKDIRALFE
jgi:superfamily II DNA or RNA helicase